MSTKTISKATKGLGWVIATAAITGSILLTVIAIKSQNTKKMSDDDFLKNLEIKGQNVSEIYASDAKITNVEYKKDSNYEINVSLEGSNVLKSTAYYKIVITNKNTKAKKSKIVPISGFKKFDEKSIILKGKELFEDKSKLKEYLDNMPKNDSENLKKYISKNKHFIYNEIPSSLKASFKGYSFIQSNGQDAVRVVFVLNGHITNDNLENNIVKKANKEYKNNEKTFEFYLSNLVKQGTSSSEIQARNNLRDLKEKYETLKKEAEVAKSKVTGAIVAEYENVLVSITKNINEIDKILNDATIKAADHVDTLKVNYEKDLLDKNTVDLKATINDAEVTRDNYKAKDETNYNNPIIEFNKAIDQAKIKLASTNIKEINDEISNLKTKKEEFINALKTILTDTQSDSKTKLLESSDYKYLIDDIKARKATFDATLNEDNILSEIENLEVLVQNTQTIDAITPKAIIEANNKLLASLLAYKTALEAKLHKIKQDVIDSTYDKDSLSQFIEYLTKKIKTTNESKALVNKQIDLFKAYLTTPGFVQKYNSLEKDFDKYEAIFNENINKANELIATLDAGLDQYSNAKDKYSEIKTKVDSLLAEQATRLSSIGTQIVNSALIDFDNYVQKQKALINTSRNNYKTIVTNVYNLFKDSEIYKQYIDDNKAKLTNSTIDVKTAFELLKTLYTKDNEMNQKVAAHSNLATNSYWNSLLDGDLKNNFTIPMQVNADYENYFKLDDHYKMALDIIMDNLISQIHSEHIKGIEAKQEEIYRIFYEKMRAIYNAQLTNGVKFVNDNILDAKNRRIQALKEYEKALKEAENLIKHYTDEHYNNTDDFLKTLEEGIKAVKTLNKDRAMLSLVKNTTIELKEVIKNSQDQYRTFLLSKLDEARKNWQIYSNSINGPEHQDVFPKTIKLINESLEKIKNAIDNSTTITIKELEDLVKENNDVDGKYTSTKIPEWNAFIKKFDSAFEELEAIKKDYKKETIVKLGKDKYQDNDLVLNPAFEANSVYQKAKEYKESGKLSVEKNLKTSKEHITKIKAKIEKIKQLVNYYETKWNQAKTNLDNTIKAVEEYITNNPSATNIDQLQALLNSTKEAIETSKLEEVNLTKLQQLDKDLEAKYQEVLNKNNSLAAAKNKLQSSIEKVENHLNSRNSLDNLDNSYYSNLMQNEKIDYNENSSTAASKKDLKSILDSMKNIVKGNDENAINHNVQFGQKLIDAIEEKRTEDIVAKQNTLKDKLNEYNDLKDSLKSLSSKDYYGAQITNLEANSTADEDADRITKLARANLIKESQKSIVNTKVELEKLIGNLTKIKTDRQALIRQANDQYNTNKDKFAELQKQLNDLNITPATTADYNTKVKPKLEAANNKNELLKEVSKDQNNSNITAKINDSKVAIQDLENVVNNYKTALNNKIKENISAIKELVQYIRNNPNNLTLPANFVTNLKAVEDNQDSTDIAILNQTKTQSEALIKELTDLINTAVATVNNKAQDTNQKVEEEKAKNETWMTVAQVREIQQLFDNSQALFNEVKNAANNKDQIKDVGVDNLTNNITKAEAKLKEIQNKKAEFKQENTNLRNQISELMNDLKVQADTLPNEFNEHILATHSSIKTIQEYYENTYSKIKNQEWENKNINDLQTIKDILDGYKQSLDNYKNEAAAAYRNKLKEQIQKSNNKAQELTTANDELTGINKVDNYSDSITKLNNQKKAEYQELIDQNNNDLKTLKNALIEIKNSNDLIEILINEVVNKKCNLINATIKEYEDQLEAINNSIYSDLYEDITTSLHLDFLNSLAILKNKYPNNLNKVIKLSEVKRDYEEIEGKLNDLKNRLAATQNERNDILAELRLNFDKINSYANYSDADSKLPLTKALINDANNNLENHFSSMTLKYLKAEKSASGQYTKVINEINQYEADLNVALQEIINEVKDAKYQKIDDIISNNSSVFLADKDDYKKTIAPVKQKANNGVNDLKTLITTIKDANEKLVAIKALGNRILTKINTEFNNRINRLKTIANETDGFLSPKVADGKYEGSILHGIKQSNDEIIKIIKTKIDTIMNNNSNLAYLVKIDNSSDKTIEKLDQLIARATQFKDNAITKTNEYERAWEEAKNENLQKLDEANGIIQFLNDKKTTSTITSEEQTALTALNTAKQNYDRIIENNIDHKSKTKIEDATNHLNDALNTARQELKNSQKTTAIINLKNLKSEINADLAKLKGYSSLSNDLTKSIGDSLVQYKASLQKVIDEIDDLVQKINTIGFVQSEYDTVYNKYKDVPNKDENIIKFIENKVFVETKFLNKYDIKLDEITNQELKDKVTTKFNEFKADIVNFCSQNITNYDADVATLTTKHQAIQNKWNADSEMIKIGKYLKYVVEATNFEKAIQAIENSYNNEPSGYKDVEAYNNFKKEEQNLASGKTSIETILNNFKNKKQSELISGNVPEDAQWYETETARIKELMSNNNQIITNKLREFDEQNIEKLRNYVEELRQLVNIYEHASIKFASTNLNDINKEISEVDALIANSKKAYKTEDKVKNSAANLSQKTLNTYNEFRTQTLNKYNQLMSLNVTPVVANVRPWLLSSDPQNDIIVNQREIDVLNNLKTNKYSLDKFNANYPANLATVNKHKIGDLLSHVEQLINDYSIIKDDIENGDFEELKKLTEFYYEARYKAKDVETKHNKEYKLFVENSFNGPNKALIEIQNSIDKHDRQYRELNEKYFFERLNSSNNAKITSLLVDNYHKYFVDLNGKLLGQVSFNNEDEKINKYRWYASIETLYKHAETFGNVALARYIKYSNVMDSLYRDLGKDPGNRRMRHNNNKIDWERNILMGYDMALDEEMLAINDPNQKFDDGYRTVMLVGGFAQYVKDHLNDKNSIYAANNGLQLWSYIFDEKTQTLDFTALNYVNEFKSKNQNIKVAKYVFDWNRGENVKNKEAVNKYFTDSTVAKELSYSGVAKYGELFNFNKVIIPDGNLFSQQVVIPLLRDETIFKDAKGQKTTIILPKNNFRYSYRLQTLYSFYENESTVGIPCPGYAYDKRYNTQFIEFVAENMQFMADTLYSENMYMWNGNWQNKGINHQYYFPIFKYHFSKTNKSTSYVDIMNTFKHVLDSRYSLLANTPYTYCLNIESFVAYKNHIIDDNAKKQYNQIVSNITNRMNSASSKEQEAKKILEEINNKLQTLKNNPNTHYFGNKNVVGRSVDQKPHITFNIAIYDENQKHDYYITSTTNYRFFLKDVSKDIY